MIIVGRETIWDGTIIGIGTLAGVGTHGMDPTGAGVGIIGMDQIGVGDGIIGMGILGAVVSINHTFNNIIKEREVLLVEMMDTPIVGIEILTEEEAIIQE
jgi:hypothetical protein